MKTALSCLVFAMFAFLHSATAQTEKPAAIVAEENKTGRWPLSDDNNDGWDDLWQNLFPHIDTSHPNLDDDKDGRTNYEEMLDFGDPNARRQAQAEVNEATSKIARQKAADAAQVNDKDKLLRFKQLLISRGVVKEAPVEDEGKKDESFNAAPMNFDEIGAPQLFLCAVRPPVTPKIIAIERLSNGQVMLAWEGEPDRLFSVEYSDDLVNWEGGADSVPLYNGVGIWGQTTSSPARFYRVEASENISDFFAVAESPGGNGDPPGGGGPHSVRVNVSVTQMEVNVTVDMDEDLAPSTVQIYVDGEYYSDLTRSAGSYSGFLNSQTIPRGQHLLHARINASSETTPGIDDLAASATIITRSQERSFENNASGITGVRATEIHILDDVPRAPQSTTIFAEYPIQYGGEVDGEPIPLTGLGDGFDISDENGNIVRSEYNESPSDGPDQVSFTWDGRGDNGATLPDGPYYLNYYHVSPGDLSLTTPILIKKGPAKTRILALGETQGGMSNTAAAVANYRPEWWTTIGSSGGPANHPSGWGPWLPLGGGPAALIGGLQRGIGKFKHAQVSFWLPNNPGNAAPWGKTASPANAFLAGNPFNSYDMGFIIGHGVACSGGSYPTANNQVKILPPQHYFPFIADRATNETVWIKSGQMAEKFGASGKLKWMYAVTCNYFRVSAHNNGAGHEIFAPMQAAGTLPMGPKLHILGSYTTSVDVDGKLGVKFSEGALQQGDDPNMTLVKAWTYAWRNSDNSGTKDAKGNPGKQIRNARSIYWPECNGDTLPGVPNEKLSTITGNANQARLEITDSGQQ